MFNLYSDAYQRSINDPDRFWGNIAEDCHWYKRWDKVLDDSNKPFYRWFTGAKTNSCYNAVDLHVDNGMGNHTAIIYDSPVTDTIKKFTFSELKEKTALFAGVLAAKGVSRRPGHHLHAHDS